MKRVLRRLGYTNKDNIIEVKGRVACEINTGDELVLTELIFMGFFNTLDVTSTVAVLTLFVFQEKSSTNEKGPKMRDELQTLLRQVQGTSGPALTRVKHDFDSFPG
jgi:ATP-dependent RNA helicase DOB1